jgi:hypothetical protein
VFSATRIVALARDLLEASPLCAIATVASRDRAHVNTAYFAWSTDFPEAPDESDYARVVAFISIAAAKTAAGSDSI